MSPLPKLTTKSNDLINIDALRFLAAFGVMVLHASIYFDFGPSYDSSIFGPLRLFVDLFFAISGFVIGYSYLDRVSTGSGVRRFWRGRFAYIYPLHLATFAASLVIGTIGAGHTEHAENYNPSCIPANLVLGQAWGLCSHLSYNGVSWSLSAEAMMYLLFPVFALAAKRKTILIPITSAAAIAILSWKTWGTSDPWYEWMAPLGAARAFPSFLLGLSLWIYRDLIRKIPHANELLMASIVSFVAMIAIRMPGLLILLNVYAVVMFACASDLQGVRSRVAWLLAPLGGLTMETYMLHQLTFIVVLTVIAKRLLGLSGTSMNVAIVATFGLVMVMAYAAKFAFVDPVKKIILSGWQWREKQVVARDAA